MHNTVINTTREALVTISRHSRSFSMLVIQDDSALKNLICSFSEQDQELYAAVIAPADDRQRLAHRVVSFLSAHLRISDTHAMEREILRCIESCLSHSKAYSK
ncbi:hypothetical protein HMY34_12145 [Thiothrix subterranea]|uniref:hypothetical protein n=1 Tax=Thiothrix subterranea TaxID=2735563 RepID=UPI00192BE508|nr:hypothetical protein [Thiothrix subterranea]QQZ29464.1 hypothetical protein HMY34_12145 [Thiothrix subterranea]